MNENTNIPRQWPSVEVVAPNIEGYAPELTSGLLDLKDKSQVDELLAFYQEHLVPQLACIPDGSGPSWPQRGWLWAEPERTAVVVRGPEGELRGAWIIKENGIYYPCATIDDIALIYRHLWAESIKHFDYLWGSTANPTIMAFAQKALQKKRWHGSPTVTDSRIEWRRS